MCKQQGNFEIGDENNISYDLSKVFNSILTKKLPVPSLRLRQLIMKAFASQREEIITADSCYETTRFNINNVWRKQNDKFDAKKVWKNCSYLINFHHLSLNKHYA